MTSSLSWPLLLASWSTFWILVLPFLYWWERKS
jgi:hypothetical protein